MVRCRTGVQSLPAPPPATCSTVRVWDAATHKCLATLVGHTGAVRALAASDNLVFSGSDDATIRVSLRPDSRREGARIQPCSTADSGLLPFPRC